MGERILCDIARGAGGAVIAPGHARNVMTNHDSVSQVHLIRSDRQSECQPILESQTRNQAKVPAVVRNQGKINGQGGACDQHINGWYFGAFPQ